MNIGRFPLAAAACLLAATTFGLGSGCAQPGPIATHRNTVGSLKASVSQLEYANDNLRKQVADLKSDASRADNELLQANNSRDEMAARLDDAKNVIRQKGGDVTALNRPSSSSSKATTAAADDDIPPPAQSPVRRSRSSRKPPAAQIPRIEDSPDKGPGSEDPGPQASRFVDDGRWLPVARGNRSRGGSIELR